MISPHISFAEATESNTAERNGIDNTPNEQHLANMRHVANEIFEPLRKFIGKPIRVNSFYRSSETNKAVGGSSTSDHCFGFAIDCSGTPYGVDNRLIFDFIRGECLFDQLIWEYGDKETPKWVHFSLKKEGGNRREVLRVFRNASGQSKYIHFDLY